MFIFYWDFCNNFLISYVIFSVYFLIYFVYYCLVFFFNVDENMLKLLWFFIGLILNFLILYYYLVLNFIFLFKFLLLFISRFYLMSNKSEVVIIIKIIYFGLGIDKEIKKVE